MRVFYDEGTGSIMVDGALFCTVWVPSHGGYVRDISCQDGTSGHQLSEELAATGNMMWVGNREALPRAIRRALRRRATRDTLSCWLTLAAASRAMGDVEPDLT
jgi:hypothetical protein